MGVLSRCHAPRGHRLHEKSRIPQERPLWNATRRGAYSAFVLQTALRTGEPLVIQPRQAQRPELSRRHAVRAAERTRKVGGTIETEPTADLRYTDRPRTNQFVGGSTQAAIADVVVEAAFILEHAIPRGARQRKMAKDFFRRQFAAMKMVADVMLDVPEHRRTCSGASAVCADSLHLLPPAEDFRPRLLRPVAGMKSQHQHLTMPNQTRAPASRRLLPTL